MALKTAEQNAGKRVTQITLKVGTLSGILPQYMQQFFAMISKDTIAEGAHLNIETEPALFLCRSCSSQTELSGSEHWDCKKSEKYIPLQGLLGQIGCVKLQLDSHFYGSFTC